MRKFMPGRLFTESGVTRVPIFHVVGNIRIAYYVLHNIPADTSRITIF